MARESSYRFGDVHCRSRKIGVCGFGAIVRTGITNQHQIPLQSTPGTSYAEQPIQHSFAPSMYKWIPINSTSDLAQLTNHVSSEYNPEPVSKKLAQGISKAVKAVLIEDNYIDKDYRSTYYNFYSKKGQRYRADCVRLHFFDETVSFDEETLKLSCLDNRLSDHYFGYMVLRPTGIATIGRTVLSPDVRSGASRFIITGDHKVHLLGYKLTVQGFPSMDQHVDISVCAHAACWSILRHYSERHSSYREYLIHDITMMAH